MDLDFTTSRSCDIPSADFCDCMPLNFAHSDAIFSTQLQYCNTVDPVLEFGASFHVAAGHFGLERHLLASIGEGPLRGVTVKCVRSSLQTH